ncbi:O-methylsterigmatocystin oxidoreductase [Colletotrichum spinosum]|uniref:O-methylsterigmatocystin oxidoreductase n=1 Tax=Colletotrichum spinosum TaxID=1347390 RepID=A0A4R8QH89_9PEZI|nr:O-methylsterigmatocystin oxidoreductase [Colletotrichum spinosum]
MPDSRIFVGFVATLLTIFLFDRLLRAARNFSRLPLPPGPKGLPFVGNVRDLPKQDTFEAVHWAKFGELYGPISSINVLGKTIIVVNDAKTAIDMLEKQSTYSSRPQFYFTGEIVGWGDTTVSLSYNEKLRSHRKNFARIIGTKSSTAQYHAMQEAEVAHFLLHLLDDPDNLRDHIKRQVRLPSSNLHDGENDNVTSALGKLVRSY